MDAKCCDGNEPCQNRISFTRVQEGFMDLIFTPANEVDLCGHATLASAHILYVNKVLSVDLKRSFYANPGMLQAKRAIMLKFN
ncbi:MAG: PhzF family phenazine biosynthesis protein [Bdellovibrionota bacterium]